MKAGVQFAEEVDEATHREDCKVEAEEDAVSCKQLLAQEKQLTKQLQLASSVLCVEEDFTRVAKRSWDTCVRVSCRTAGATCAQSASI